MTVTELIEKHAYKLNRLTGNDVSQEEGSRRFKNFAIELLEQIMAKANGNSDAAKPDVVYVEIEEAMEELRK